MLRRTSSQWAVRPGSDQLATNPNLVMVEAWPFASITSAQTLPLVIGYLLGQPPRHLRRATLRCRPTAARLTSPPAHNTGPVPPATAAVVGHCRTPYPQLPRQSGTASRHRAADHLLGQLCFGAKVPAHRLPPHPVRRPPGRAPGRKAAPRRLGRPGILRSDSSGLPRRAAVLSRYPHRLLALLEKPGLIHYQHALRDRPNAPSRTLAGRPEPGPRGSGTPPARCTPSGDADAYSANCRSIRAGWTPVPQILADETHCG